MNAKFAYGRKPRSRHSWVPHYSSLVAGRKLPPPKDATDWVTSMPTDLGMLLNGQDVKDPNAPILGDCADAAIYHLDQVWTFNVENKIWMPPNDIVEQLYELQGGYVPGNDATDQGTILQDLLTYLLKTGMPMPDGTANKILGFIEVDPRNFDDVRRVIDNCGGAYIGFNVPVYLMSGEEPPEVWDLNEKADNSLDGGHCVINVGQTADKLRTVSWGSTNYWMTKAFFQRFVTEVYAIIDEEWIKSTGLTPAGLTLAQLQQNLASLQHHANA